MTRIRCTSRHSAAFLLLICSAPALADHVPPDGSSPPPGFPVRNWGAPCRGGVAGSEPYTLAPDSLKCGHMSAATGEGSTAVGVNAQSLSRDATALGVDALATGEGGTALGSGSIATGVNATAVGRDSVASHNGSTALGAGSFTTAPNQVTLGGPGTSVRLGDVAASTAAQSGPTGVVTIDSSGTLGRDTTIVPAIRVLQSATSAHADQIAGLQAGQQLLSSRVDSLFDLREADQRDVRAGIAAAVAMGDAAMPSAPGRTSYVFNLATFRGEQALGGSIMHRLNSDNPVALSVGFSYGGNRNNAARVGVAGEF